MLPRPRNGFAKPETQKQKSRPKPPVPLFGETASVGLPPVPLFDAPASAPVSSPAPAPAPAPSTTPTESPTVKQQPSDDASFPSSPPTFSTDSASAPTSTVPSATTVHSVPATHATPRMVTPPAHTYTPPSWGGIPCASIHLEVVRQGVELPPIHLCGPLQAMYPHMATLARRVKQYGAEEEYMQNVDAERVNVLYRALAQAEQDRHADKASTTSASSSSLPHPPAISSIGAVPASTTPSFSNDIATDIATGDISASTSTTEPVSGPTGSAWASGSPASRVSPVRDSSGSPYASLSGLSYITIGRVPVAHVQVEHPSLSRIHCIVQLKANGEVYLHDISTHGVRVNKTPIAKHTPYRVYDGDTFTLGESSRMFVVCHSDHMSRAEATGATQDLYVPKAEREKIMLAKMEKARNIAAMHARMHGATSTHAHTQTQMQADAGADARADTDTAIVIRDAEEEETVFRAWLEWDEDNDVLQHTNILATDVGSVGLGLGGSSRGAASTAVHSSLQAMLRRIGKTDKQRALIDKYRDSMRRVATLQERLNDLSEGMGKRRNISSGSGSGAGADKLRTQLEAAMEAVEEAEEVLLTSFRAKLGYGGGVGDRKRMHEDSDEEEEVYDRTKRNRTDEVAPVTGYAALLRGSKPSTSSHTSTPASSALHTTVTSVTCLHDASLEAAQRDREAAVEALDTTVMMLDQCGGARAGTGTGASGKGGFFGDLHRQKEELERVIVALDAEIKKRTKQ